MLARLAYLSRELEHNPCGRRNGYSKQTIVTESAKLDIRISRDWKGHLI
jgi:transposase-like protein